MQSEMMSTHFVLPFASCLHPFYSIFCLQAMLELHSTKKFIRYGFRIKKKKTNPAYTILNARDFVYRQGY